MNIEKTYKPGDDFVVLRVICPPLPDKMVSVSIDALAEGKLTLEIEIARETVLAEERLIKHKFISGLLTPKGTLE